MRPLNWILAAALILTMGSAFATEVGGKEGGGGDAADCTASPDNSFQGVYVLDYLDAVANPNMQLQSADDIGEIVKTLKNAIPKLGEDLEAFVDSYEQRTSQKRDAHYYWSAAEYGVPVKDDQNLTRNLPPNCQKLVRIVHRTNGSQINLEYSPKLMAEVKKRNQFSWIAVHEWYRNYTQDASRIRKINEYLHSQEFLNASDEDIFETISVLGVLDSRVFKSKTKLAEIAQRVKPFVDLYVDAHQTLHSAACTPAWVASAETARDNIHQMLAQPGAFSVDNPYSSALHNISELLLKSITACAKI